MRSVDNPRKILLALYAPASASAPTLQGRAAHLRVLLAREVFDPFVVLLELFLLRRCALFHAGVCASFLVSPRRCWRMKK
jgi:hypothetical protein